VRLERHGRARRELHPGAKEVAGTEQLGARALSDLHGAGQQTVGGSRPLSHLADAAGIAPATATRVVDGLEKAGLVRRGRSMADRRTVFISLTAEGRRRVRRKRDRIRRRRQRVYEGLAPDEQEQAERLLRHLTNLLGAL
jgi:DNA-binding MarR family transcriptional regulator